MSVLSSTVKADYHIHSLHSPDSQVPLAVHVERALELGLAELCFTDHAEIDPFMGNVWTLDFKQYYADYLRLQERYPQIKLKFGYELGLPAAPFTMAEVRREIPELPYDFVLASIHGAAETSPFTPAFYQGRSYASACEAYLRAIYEGVQNLQEHEYCAIGHIDCPCKLPERVHGQADPRVRLSYFSDVFDSLAKYLIERGKTIEINTSAYRNIGQRPLPGGDWLRRFAELGGEFVTFGSDAHRVEHLGNRLSEAAELAKACGIKYYATYEQMKPILHPL